MSNVQFIEEWNNIIPCKIKDTDLAKPTEKFLFKALISILKLMQIEVNSLNSLFNEPYEVAHLLRIKLVGYINKLYKISSDAKHTFCYMDLVLPSPKKTVHVLKVLLNYLLYFNMVKEEVTIRANVAILKETKIETAKNQLRIEFERQQCKTANIGKSIKDLRINIKANEDQLDLLTNEDRHLKEQIRKDEEKNVICDGKLLENESLLNTLKTQIVPDVEVDNFIQTKTSLQSQITEQEEYEKEARQSHLENSVSLLQRQETLKKIIETADLFQTISQYLVPVQLEMLNVERQLNQQINISEQHNNDLSTLVAQCQQKEKSLKVKTKKCATTNKTNIRNVKKEQRKIFGEQSKCRRAQKENANAISEVLMQKSEIENIYKVSNLIIEI